MLAGCRRPTWTSLCKVPAAIGFKKEKRRRPTEAAMATTRNRATRQNRVKEGWWMLERRKNVRPLRGKLFNVFTPCCPVNHGPKTSKVRCTLFVAGILESTPPIHLQMHLIHLHFCTFAAAITSSKMPVIKLTLCDGYNQIPFDVTIDPGPLRQIDR